MLVALLQNKEHKHEILDDQESVFHVLIWFVLHYTLYSHQDDVELHIILYNEIYCNETVREEFVAMYSA